MKLSRKSLVVVWSALAMALLAGPGEAAAPTVQTRLDPADSPGPTAADLRAVIWSLEGGSAKLEVHLRDQATMDQRVLLWADSNSDGKADLVVRIQRETKTTANIAVEPVTAASTTPCQPFTGDQPIATNPAALVTVDGGLMKVSLTFPFEPADGRFRWAAYGDSTVDSGPSDFLPDSLAPVEDKDRFCSGGINADLAKGARFPDGVPVAALMTDYAQPLDDRPFKVISTATDPDGSIVSWRWDTGGDDAFDDGSGSEMELQLSAGEHSVALMVTDDDGLTAIDRQTITVRSTGQAFTLATLSLFSERLPFIPDGIHPPKGTALDGGNKAPVVRARVTPRRPRVGQLVSLDAGATRDDGKLASFEWDLDGDGEADDARGVKVRYAFGLAGKARVTVQARDDRGLVARGPITVKVAAARPLPIMAAIKRARRAGKPAGSFERGLSGWKRVGKAFPAKPVRRPTLPASVDLRTASRLGGTYASAPVPVNAAGKGWVSSRTKGPKLKGLTPEARGNLATGALVSPAFPVTKRYLTLRVGGQDQLRGKRSLERVEVWVRKGAKTRKVATIPAGGNERLTQHVIDLRRHRGSTATVVAVDASAAGHINLDDLLAASRPPLATVPEREAEALYAPLLGFADTHTHAMVHQSFGGLRGHRTYMGVPGGRYTDYLRGTEGAKAYDEDMRDNPTHFAGSGPVRSALQAVHSLAPDRASGLHQHMHITEIRRAYDGGLRLMSSLAVNNQGLEHMTGRMFRRLDSTEEPCQLWALPVAPLCSEGSTALGTIQTTPEAQIIEASVHGMRVLADMNSDWMEIAYSPQQAHRIIAGGKLAIVLGTEVDSLGNLGFNTAEEEVHWLWRRGIRQVAPVHGIDNRIGGAVAFQDVYNSTQDLVNRRVRNADATIMANETRFGSDGLFLRNPAANFGDLMRVENHGCRPERPVGECVSWRYAPNQTLIGLQASRIVGPYPWFIATDARSPAYDVMPPGDGHRNRAGLTSYGVDYVRSLIRHGMLVDIEHMGDRTIDAIIASGTTPGEPRGPVWDALGTTGNGCEPGGPGRPRSVRPDCYDLAYPVMSSHTSLRGQSMVPYPYLARDVTDLPAVSLLKDNWAREYERTPRQIEFIRDSGGTIAPFSGSEPTLRPRTITRPSRGAPGVPVFRGEDYGLVTNPDRLDLNDCAGSSKSWITSYLYALQKMGGRGVAIATDMGVSQAGPRFNRSGYDALLPKNCPASYANFNPELDPTQWANPFALFSLRQQTARSRDREEAGYQWMYNRVQTNELQYHRADGGTPPAGSLLKHVTPSGRTYDFNTEGMGTYGALPDLIQDAVNVGVAPEDLRPLLHSAQHYIDMWSKAYRVTGCAGEGRSEADYERCAGTSQLIDPGRGPCANTCPDSPGRGHERFPDGSPMRFPPG